MDVDAQGIVADEVFLGLMPVPGLALLDLIGLQLAAAVGDIARTVDQRRDADARAAAGHFNGDGRLNFAVGLGPGLGKVHHRVGTDVLDGSDRPFAAAARAVLFAAAGEQQARGERGHGAQPNTPLELRAFGPGVLFFYSSSSPRTASTRSLVCS